MSKLTKEDYKQAILVQDACNLSGVLLSFLEVIKKIREEENDTKKINEHPICKLYADKIYSLAFNRALSRINDKHADAMSTCEKRRI